jgi:hypothetical protein
MYCRVPLSKLFERPCTQLQLSRAASLMSFHSLLSSNGSSQKNVHPTQVPQPAPCALFPQIS